VVKISEGSVEEGIRRTLTRECHVSSTLHLWLWLLVGVWKTRGKHSTNIVFTNATYRKYVCVVHYFTI